MSRRFAPFAKPVTRHGPPDVIPEGAADPPPFDDYPPIEQFLDELPSIDDYVVDELVPTVDDTGNDAFPVATDDRDEVTHVSEGWAVSEWQSYDWSGLAALGRPLAQSATGTEWAATEWPRSRFSGEGQSTSGAEEVAQVLDDIAQRIRSGELPIEQFRTSPPEAAVAAALAAILRTRS